MMESILGWNSGQARQEKSISTTIDLLKNLNIYLESPTQLWCQIRDQMLFNLKEKKVGVSGAVGAELTFDV
jgi:hypothetical protein